MTVIAPPQAPERVEPLLEPAERDALEALIEEARRRARRRRSRYAACALLAATLSALFALSRSGGDAAAPAGRLSLEPRRGGGDLLDRDALAAGRLTLIGRSGDEAPRHDGWYEFSMLDDHGRLRPFLRCPDEADYCGVVESVAWSRDGRWLAFTVGAHGAINPYIGLHVLDTHSGRERHIADASVCGFVERSDVAWSPDGSQIAYVCSRAVDRRRTLVLATRDGRIRALHTGQPGSLTSPTWSPRGDTIAFATRAPWAKPAISLIDISGSVTTTLALDATAPSWSPDGKRIAYRAGCGGIKLMTPAGLDVTPGSRLRPSRPPVVPNDRFACRSIGVAGTPRWSPDGEQLAINNSSGIYLMNKDGSSRRRITTHSGIGHHGGHPAWRPSTSGSRDRAR